MQGIFINGKRPKSKKQIREAIESRDAAFVHIEATSMFGNEYDGSVADVPDGEYLFVGPDPYTKRNFYGKIVKRDGKVTVK